MKKNALVKSPVKILPAGGSYGRLFTAPSPRVQGIRQGIGWFGPEQAIAPVAPPGTTPRGFQYTPGQNLIYTPRATEDLTMEDLREFAKYPIVRYIIETRIDQICRQAWSIRVKPKAGESNRQRLAREAGDKIVQQLTNFLQYPNPDCTWRSFLRMLMDDVLVIDAPAILLRRNALGDIAEMRAIDGATIVRYINEQGWTPDKGKAYAQLWYGIPMVDLTTDQLVYRPEHPRTNKLYGYSRVEQAYKQIILGQNRLEMQLQFYENGSIPDGIMVVPPTATPEQIERQQNWMNSTLAGNLSRRVQLRLIQGFNIDGKPEQILFPKEKLITDETDDFIIRSLCFAFQVSPQRWMKMVNRASAEASQEAAEEEGLAPTKDYVRDLMNYIIQCKLGFVEHEFAWADHRDPDILKQAQADELYVKAGINTINEIRESKGDDPSPNPAADQLNIVTGQGTVEVGQTLPSKQAEQLAGSKSGTGGRPGSLTSTGTVNKPPSTSQVSPAKQKDSKKKALEAGDLSKGYKFASTQINLPGPYAEEIIELGRSLIPEEDLDGRGRETEPHVTVKYGVHENEQRLRMALENHEPIEILLGPVETFEPSEHSDGAAPVVIKVISGDLRKVRRDVDTFVGAMPDNFDYTPHVTIAYVRADCASKYQGAGDFSDVKFIAKSMSLCKMDGTKLEVPLGKSEE